MGALWQDIRYGARMLVKNRSVSLIAVLTLALGIGANTAIFTVVHAVLLRPLPYGEPAQLVHLWETRPRAGFDQMEASRPNFLDWKARNTVFVDLAGYNQGAGFARFGSESEMIFGGRGTPNFFDVLGVKPILGRTFRPEEERPGTPA